MLRSACRLGGLGPRTAALIKIESKCSAHNYAPLSVMFRTAHGCVVKDVDGKNYFDFLSGYGAVSQGHLHPKVVKAAKDQLSRCTLSSRAFHSEQFALYSQFVTKMFGYDKVLPMNTGAEGVETSLKLARKWGYKVKGIPADQALIVCVEGNFHGRTFGAISMSDDPDSYHNYGPLLPGIRRVPYGDLPALERCFKEFGKQIAAFICEPIQGEAGIVIPPEGYLRGVRRLCTEHNILYIDDEIQSGCGRTGKLLAVEHEAVRPDVVILAKALGGGVIPVAAVLADAAVMDVFEPGTHGSTFGGNPLACAVAIASLKVIKEEGLVQNSAKMGKLLLKELAKFREEFPGIVEEVRGRGLFTAMVFNEHLLQGKVGYRYMYILKEHGILAKITHGNIIRITPPLTITEKQIRAGSVKLRAALKQLRDELNSGKVGETGH